MAENQDYDLGSGLSVKEEDKKRFLRLKIRYEEMKSPFFDMAQVDFADKMLDLGFEELNITKEDFEEAFEKEKDSD